MRGISSDSPEFDGAAVFKPALREDLLRTSLTFADRGSAPVRPPASGRDEDEDSGRRCAWARLRVYRRDTAGGAVAEEPRADGIRTSQPSLPWFLLPRCRGQVRLGRLRLRRRRDCFPLFRCGDLIPRLRSRFSSIIRRHSRRRLVKPCFLRSAGSAVLRARRLCGQAAGKVAGHHRVP